VLPATASGCGYDVQIGGGISTAHAASIPVALAVHDAVSTGRLARLPDAPAPLALLRANGAMSTFAFVLKPGAAALPPMALVFVEAHLWGRYTQEPAGTRFQPHVDGPGPGDVVLVTGEPVLRALLDGSITWAAALATGLVVVDGPAEGRERVSRFLVQQTS
jgi:hypothetical protein